MPTINFSIDETTSANAQAAATALRSLTQEYQKLNRVLVKTEKQLLKFDEINRLVAYGDKPVSAGRASSGRSSSSSKTTTKKTDSAPKAETTAGGKSNGYSPRDTSASLPLHLALKDILFEWGDLNWEIIMMKLIAGLNMLTGGIVGFMLGGPAGAFMGLTLGLLFSILADAAIFNFDGKLSQEEFLNGLKALLPVAGGILGFVIGGPLGAAIGATLGAFLSFKLLGIDWSDAMGSLEAFFKDFHDFARLRLDSVQRLFYDSIEGLKRWWANLSFRGFHLSLPHLAVQWEYLNANSALARFLGINAVPHLSVQWYARGGIVNGATLIGAGEAGKEAIIPLERHTEWIRMVAEELAAQLQALSPAPAFALVPLPAAGSIVPPGALNSESRPSTDGLANAIVSALSAMNSPGTGSSAEPVIRVYLDGKQLSDAVTKYQRREARASG